MITSQRALSHKNQSDSTLGLNTNSWEVGQKSEMSSSLLLSSNERSGMGNLQGKASLFSLGIANFHNVSILPPTALPIQTKLKINTPGDKYEQEADAVADQVMRMHATNVQRKCAECEKEEMIQTKSRGNLGNTASSALMSQIQSTRCGGQAMDMGIRSFMEPRFGADFSGVRIHSNGQAAEMNREINARAFTVGGDIYFNSGAYNPVSAEGKKLLAHELTHVMQQHNSTVKNSIQKQDDSPATLGGPSTPLNTGEVVRVEVRAGAGSIEPMTHNYPVSPNGCVNLPMVGCIQARGRTPTQLRSDINQALITGSIYVNPTVNVTFVNKTVDYSHSVSVGESVFVRTLSGAGAEEFSGSFPVDGNGQIHIPMVGDLTVQGLNYSTIETMIKDRLISGQFLNNPTVHVAGSRI